MNKGVLFTWLTCSSRTCHLLQVARVSFMEVTFFFFFFNLFIYLFIFRARGREGERQGEKHQCVVASCVPLTGDLACNPGMCPDWESNQEPFGSQASTQSTELHQPGLEVTFKGQSSRHAENLKGI